MKKKTEMMSYEPLKLEVVEVEVERGFALSTGVGNEGYDVEFGIWDYLIFTL